MNRIALVVLMVALAGCRSHEKPKDAPVAHHDAAGTLAWQAGDGGTSITASGGDPAGEANRFFVGVVPVQKVQTHKEVPSYDPVPAMKRVVSSVNEVWYNACRTVAKGDAISLGFCDTIHDIYSGVSKASGNARAVTVAPPAPKAAPTPKPKAPVEPAPTETLTGDSAVLSWGSCMKYVEAYGEHVRFSPDDQIQLLLSDRKNREAYEAWEVASRPPYFQLTEKERAYNATVLPRSYYDGLMAKYGIGPIATLDQDLGGATPVGGCVKWGTDKQ